MEEGSLLMHACMVACKTRWSSPFFLQGISCIEAHPLHVCHPLRTRKGNYKAFEFHIWRCMMAWSVWVAVSKPTVSRKALERFIKRELQSKQKWLRIHANAICFGNRGPGSGSLKFMLKKPAKKHQDWRTGLAEVWRMESLKLKLS